MTNDIEKQFFEYLRRSKMSYTMETIKELFLVTRHFGANDDLHRIMNKKEIQEALKSEFAYLITDIQKIEIIPVEKVSRKYFLPKDWQKIDKRTVNYRIWKEIAESEEQ